SCATKVVSLPTTPDGQALSTEAGLREIHPEQDLIVSSCDHGIVVSDDIWSKFHKNPDCDAAIFTITGFPGVLRRPEAYAYVKAETDLTVSSVSVKKPISPTPDRDPLLVGTFWFKKAKLLKEGIEVMKRHPELRVNGELYLDSIFNIFINKLNLKVRIIPLSGYINWGDPQSLAEALYWEENFLNPDKRRSRV
ncbi:unnamed protein product, partial [Rotaria magnacalcarata]